ncbi:P-loop containing nucleoside triphosphate hydrolase protein, partial [Mycena latifolia]
MPLPPTAAQIRLNNIATSLSAAVTTLDVVTESLKTPFLQPISNTMHSLLTAVQTVKRNQDDCAQMLEQVHELLHAIIWVHVKSDTGGELSPSMLDNLGKFTETLHKIHNFIEAEQEKSKIKHFFHQGEMKSLLKACHTGLEQALEMFKIQGAKVLSDMVEMQEHAQKTHKEVLELLSSLSDSESGSSISRVLSSSHNSSNSFSLLPSEPKIFHGRESEVSIIIQQLNQKIPRIAILGGGGMGKTSLARAVLHHPQISAKYEKHRFFVACDAASSSVHLATLIGAHLGLPPGQDLTKPVIQYFSNGPPCLLILDNLETVWEPKESRADVEKLLALLEDIEHLTLIITMRGAERPASVRWTHPFLQPLQPLAQDAARKTFIDIVDDGYTVEDIDKILLLADNMPLAIDLIAHLVDYDGFDSVMEHWETERTSLLSEGHNKGSNLNLSISMSLESPRLASVPHARDLLSLLSMLPDGLSDVELKQSKLPIENVLACKAALLCTSLAYTDDQKRLKALVPIREYMQKMHPPLIPMVQPLRKHFSELLEVYETYHGTASSPGIVARITSNFANIENVLVMGLAPDNSDIVKTIYSTCNFSRFSRLTGHGQSQLIHQIPKVLPHPRDHRLEVYWMMTVISGYAYHMLPNRQQIVDQALDYLSHFDDPDLECRSYLALLAYYYGWKHDIPRATSLAQNGLS